MRHIRRWVYVWTNPSNSHKVNQIFQWHFQSSPRNELSSWILKGRLIHKYLRTMQFPPVEIVRQFDTAGGNHCRPEMLREGYCIITQIFVGIMGAGLFVKSAGSSIWLLYWYGVS